MAPNTALCLIVAGLALIVQQLDISRFYWRAVLDVFATFVALFGLLTTIEYLTGISLGIDRLFLANKLYEWTAPNVLPGRFAPNTAVAFAFIGLALLCPKARAGGFRWSEILALPVVLISFLSIVGYSYGAEPLYGIASYSSMALHTAICLAALGVGILWSRSQRGMMALVLSDDPGGVAARRLLVVTVIALPALGWLRVKAENHRILNLQFGTALLVIVSVIVFAVMIVQTAYILRELDAKRRRAEDSLLRSHAELENLVNERTVALRHLSTRLMRLQDEERRKIARELHDSMGQYLAGLAINLDRLAEKAPDFAAPIVECRELLDRTISEMRTLSHLLHPPLLDEVGFASAAQWFVEGFAKRSGVQANLELPPHLPRLPQAVEIGLFRVLQEALTNLHRHSGSLRAEIWLEVADQRLSLNIRDFGKGIPIDVLERWRTSGAAGVGLAGMRERVGELGGQVQISQANPGTLVQVVVPFAETARVPSESRASA